MRELLQRDELIREFEHAWQHGECPEIEQYLSKPCDDQSTGDSSLWLLAELICLDLEFRWKDKQGDTSLRVEDYLDRFPSLKSRDDILIEIVAEEYRARHRWRDAPPHEEYATRFATLSQRLSEVLEQVDAELDAETDSTQSVAVVLEHATLPLDHQEAPLLFDDYLLKRQIGAGAVGKVYLAFQKSLQRTVAVKFLRKSFCNQKWAIRRFINEARTVASLTHRGIVGIHGLGRTPGGGYFIVMDHIEQGDIQQQIEAGEVSLRQAAIWVAEACEAIQHAHDHNVVHCDLKPANLLLGSDGHVRVTDFGFARSLKSSEYSMPEIAGTAPFMAPEQIADVWGPISERTDVYGLGGILFALLTGRPPYVGDRISEILTNIISAGTAPHPGHINPEIPSRLNEICQKCLVLDPAQRFESAAELYAVLIESDKRT